MDNSNNNNNDNNNTNNNNGFETINDQLNLTIPKFKISILGDRGVGKSSYVTRFLTGEFCDKYSPTIGCEKNEILFHTNYGPILLDIWEPAGLIRHTNYPGSHAAILMFNFEIRFTYINTPQMYQELTRECNKIPTVLVGNKMDLPRKRKLLKIHQVAYHRKIQTLLYTISVKKMINLEKPLLYLISQLIGRDDVRFVEDPAISPPMVESSMRTEENLRKMEQLADAGAQVPLPDEDEDEVEEYYS